MDVTHLKIAEAARTAGVSPSTLRLWEQQGLVVPIRTPTGQRLYDAALIERLKTISWLRSEKGLNPAAIKQALIPNSGGDRRSEEPTEVRVGIDLSIGMKVRHLRKEAGLTLEAVARATGTALSVLSTFERTSQGISVTALHNVAQHLGTTIATLSGQGKSRNGASLVRDGQWTTWPTTASGVTIRVLADGNNQMECHRFDLAPGASSEGAYQHEGEEFIHVLAGSLEIILDGDQFHELRLGDSFYFESTRLHSWRNNFDGPTTLIWINTPPTF
ncbi:DNA-binding transcriptional MerR regulator/quercetin dioxygenase-like cupin family protein [Rhizobium sp. BK650]|uniref:MerR family transcriptional regulator n=1 Tax=Rhizobium sp. BK650 TaxID=2586990 RepID=UPI00161E4D21|nr:MerR family transcriptional regulator [Rhizobium sp. BK650]MBB3660629.1 DNA-binding transcriptional MerR regulator/quercetin dioxygenase-like cupin family protein [Rhizobium sp. BK650]